MPILLGWVNSEYTYLKRQLEAKEQELKKETRLQESMKLKKSELIEKMRRPIEQYYNAIGSILEDDLSFLEINRIASNLPEVPKSVEEDSDIKNQISSLKKKRSEYSSELSEVNSLLEQINNNFSEAYSYGKMLSQIVLTNDFEESKDNIECPVCHQKVVEVEETLKKINTSRKNLISELKSVGKYQHDSSEHINQLIEKRDSCKKNIKLVSAEITNLEKVTQSVINDQSLRETLIYLRGRIAATLDLLRQNK